MATKIDRYAPHALDAVDIARGKIGTRYPHGWCLRWVAGIYGVPGVGDWDGDSANDAEDFWKAAKARGTVIETSNPDDVDQVGAAVCFVGGSHDNGHIAIISGKGTMIGTDAPKMNVIDEVPIQWIIDHWRLKLVGVILVDGNGYRLTRQANEPALKTYRVTAESGLRGRALPNTSAATIKVAKLGTKLTPTHLVQNAGRVWAVVPDKGTDLYYAFEYLERI